MKKLRIKKPPGDAFWKDVKKIRKELGEVVAGAN